MKMGMILQGLGDLQIVGSLEKVNNLGLHS